MYAQTNFTPTNVIALHCSGAGAGQWRQLGEALRTKYSLIAPEHYGCDSIGPWTGGHAFSLADEAARTIDLIDRSACNVHLVGHSYGGGVALHIALARSDRIASLSLYEPSAFHLIRTMGAGSAEAIGEIRAIAATTGQGVITGDYEGAAAAFVNYWSGQGAWASLRSSVRAALIRWVPKAPLDFRALIEEHTPPTAYASLRILAWLPSVTKLFSTRSQGDVPAHVDGAPLPSYDGRVRHRPPIRCCVRSRQETYLAIRSPIWGS
jgi:pimeloyl-ACP methyl ester carboxylesterase